MFNKILKFENNEIGYSIFTAKIEDIKILLITIFKFFLKINLPFFEIN